MAAEQLWEAAQRGARALLESRDADGLVGGDSILDYYKAPWGLAAAGWVREAEQVLDAACRRALVAPGQFHDGDDVPELLRSSTYRNVIIMQAAALLSRFDVCGQAARSDLAGYQDPRHGGFYSERDRTAAREMNGNNTSMAGLFCLQVGWRRQPGAQRTTCWLISTCSRASIAAFTSIPRPTAACSRRWTT